MKADVEDLRNLQLVEVSRRGVLARWSVTRAVDRSECAETVS